MKEIYSLLEWIVAIPKWRFFEFLIVVHSCCAHPITMHCITEDGYYHYDETMIPINYQMAGQTLDNELFRELICPMPEGSTYATSANYNR
jgi:hypothetical protein